MVSIALTFGITQTHWQCLCLCHFFHLWLCHHNIAEAIRLRETQLWFCYFYWFMLHSSWTIFGHTEHYCVMLIHLFFPQQYVILGTSVGPQTGPAEKVFTVRQRWGERQVSWKAVFKRDLFYSPRFFHFLCKLCFILKILYLHTSCSPVMIYTSQASIKQTDL